MGLENILPISPTQIREIGQVEKEAFKLYKLGSRAEMFSSGKKINNMEFLVKPKKISIPSKQIKNLFSFNLHRTDERKVFISIAQKIWKEHVQWIPEERYKLICECKSLREYDEKTEYEKELLLSSYFDADKEEREKALENYEKERIPYIEGLEKQRTKIRTIGYLKFDINEIKDEEIVQYIIKKADNDVLGLNSPYLYDYFILDGDRKSRIIAKKYGKMRFYRHYQVKWKKPYMPHEFFTMDEIIHNKPNLKGIKLSNFRNKPDVYVGAPTLIRHKRANPFVAEQHLLYVDLDYYKVKEYEHLTDWEMYYLCIKELDKAGIPRPTDMDSTRGITLKWKTSPIGAWKKAHWKKLQELIFNALKQFGADKQVSSDFVRLSRLDGSIHSHINKKIYSYVFSEDRYNFDNLLQTLLPEYYQEVQERRLKAIEGGKNKAGKLDATDSKTPKENSKSSKKHKASSKRVKVFFDATLPQEYFNANYKHLRIITAIHQLVDVRADNPEKWIGYREFVVFLTRYYYLCMTGSKSYATKMAKEMYYAVNAFERYEWDEMNTLTSSANDAWERWKKDWTTGYNYKFKTLIEELGIKISEQRKIKYLKTEEVQATEKRERDKESKRKKRKEEGKLTRKEKTAITMEKVREVLMENPKASNPIISEITKIPVDTLKPYAAKIRKEIN